MIDFYGPDSVADLDLWTAPLFIAFTKSVAGPSTSHKCYRASTCTTIDQTYILWNVNNLTYQMAFLIFGAMPASISHADLNGATFTGITSGATFRQSDYLSTTVCTKLSGTVQEQIWRGGASQAYPPDSDVNCYARLGVTGLQTVPGDGSIWGVSYFTNDTMSGADTDNYSSWINGEQATVEWPE